MENFGRYKYIAIGGILFVIIILLVVTNAVRNQLNKNNSNTLNPDTTNVPLTGGPTITRVPLNNLKTIEKVPTLPPSKGQGIDINSKEVNTSTSAIETLSKSLPYNKKFTSSQGIPVEILIPPPTLLENEWTLTIQIFGIDYQIPESDPQYDAMKNSFLDAASDVFRFIQSNGVDPNNLIVQWGDREFIQQRSAEWLQQ
jgi:hypothetical protein